jgi:hypothetical protein
MIRMNWSIRILPLVILVLGNTAESQEGRGRGPGFGRQGGSIVSLVGNEAVQKELGLSESDAVAVKKVSDAYRQEQRDEFGKLGIGDFQSLQSLPAEERQAKFREIGEKTAALSRKLDEKFAPQIKSAIKPEQFERLQQISRQARGIQVFSDPEVVKELALTKEQQDRLAAIRDEYERKQRELFSEGGGTDARERFAKLREERDARAAEVLNKEQSDTLAKLKGKPFDLTQLRGGPGGRPGSAGGSRPPRSGDDKK